MFAGEGGPERTNKRFHLVSLGMDAKRLSTAFDSVTLYGNNPGKRPDIYGKIGNAGVSICCLDDLKNSTLVLRPANPMTFCKHDYQWSHLCYLLYEWLLIRSVRNT